MGKIRKVEDVKLFSGLIAKDKETISAAEEKLEKLFGKIDIRSKILKFTFTDYYEEEMGRNLLRCWVSFEKPISPEALAEIKVKTNKIENKLTDSDKRRINIDPGYIDGAKIILASTKNFSHRIYLSKGIYGEVTSIYKGKNFHFLEWTYPDYKAEDAISFFLEARNKHLK